MEMSELAKRCKCCSCEGPLPANPYLVQLSVNIPWEFPKWGNFLTKEKSKGVAFICQDCADEQKKERIQFAVEFQGNEIVYHSLIWVGDTCALL